MTAVLNIDKRPENADWLRKKIRVSGGKGSGNFGHAGRPGQVGGSSTDTDIREFTSAAEMRQRPLPTSLRSVENRIRHEQNEHAYWLKNGVVAGYNGSDDPTGVKLTHVPEDQYGKDTDPYKDAVFVHNHPKGTGLSRDDVFSAATHNMQEIRAVGSNGTTYSAARVGESWHDPSMLVQLANIETAQVHQEFSKRVKDGMMTIAQAEREHWPTVWTRVARIANSQGERIRFTVDHAGR